MLIKPVLPMAAQLGIYILLLFKRSARDLWGHITYSRKENKREKHPVRIEPMTSRLVDQRTNCFVAQNRRKTSNDNNLNLEH